MADISKINLPNDTNNPYDIADTTARSGLSDKMDKANPTGTGSLSLNRSGSTGTNSVAVGTNCIASGEDSHAEGNGTTASGFRSHTEGRATVANHRSQHVFGEFNLEDTSTAQPNARGNYVEIVGNGASTNSRSNARTLDWSGNEVLAGDLTINGNVSVGNAITPYYYNANTDRNTQENRETAIKYVLTNYFSKGGTSATIRYSGGYYNSYIYCGGSSSNIQIIEFCQLQSSEEKIIYWMYTTSNNELNKIFALS